MRSNKRKYQFINIRVRSLLGLLSIVPIIDEGVSSPIPFMSSLEYRAPFNHSTPSLFHYSLNFQPRHSFAREAVLKTSIDAPAGTTRALQASSTAQLSNIHTHSITQAHHFSPWMQGRIHIPKLSSSNTDITN